MREFIPLHPIKARVSGRPASADRSVAAAGEPDQAEAALRQRLAGDPASAAAIHSLAAFLRDDGRTGEAIQTIRHGLTVSPAPAGLCNQLASYLGEEGQMTEALEAVEVALRLAPGWPQALHNRANISLALGDVEGALADGAAAIAAMPPGREQASFRLARALALLSAGRLGEGWAAYGVRLDPDYAGAPRFSVPLPRWTAAMPLEGLRLLLVGEQGVGDEILFASVVPDLLKRAGRLGLAVIPRLIPLFRRAFPGAEVVHHHTRVSKGKAHRTVPGLDPSAYDAWAPMADVLGVLRPAADAFPRREGYLKSDPDQVAHWRKVLAELPPGPRIGLTWKSLHARWGRGRFFAPFDLWRPLFDIPGATVVCLQYGDVEAEAALAQAWGRRLWRPPGLDLRDDLDGVAALMTALDGVAGMLNGTAILAGALGGPVSVATVAEAWQRLGRPGLPWFPQARVSVPDRPNDWREALAEASRGF